MSRPPVLFIPLQTGVGANGGVQSISNVINSLRDHRPIVLTNRESEKTQSWRKSGIETHVVPEAVTSGIRSDPKGYPRTYLLYHRAVRRILDSSGAGLVHANDPAALQLCLTAARSRRVPLILNLRDTLDPERRPPRRRYDYLFRAADHMLYLSNEMADDWAKVARSAKRSFEVTYSIVDLDRFRPKPLPEGPPSVLLSGLVCPKKGQLDFLLHTAPRLAAAGIRIRIAGDFDPRTSNYAAACRDAAQPLGDAVTFLGYRTDLPDLIADAQLVVVASKHEGLVRSMIEAMSCGRPVVSTPVCSAREMLEQPGESAGAVVEFGNHSGMADTILRFIDDRHAAVRAGEAGRAIAERLFRRESVVARYEDAYRQVASS